jgi:DNA-binding transcriptional MerR regulator
VREADGLIVAKRYRAAELCRVLDLQPYVLRYWATEFPQLGGAEGGAQRLYGEDELDLLRRIKRLLYEEGYTIAGARKKLETEPNAGAEARAVAPLFAESEGESETEAGAARLDSLDRERIETLRRGVAEALDEARDLLALLERNR